MALKAYIAGPDVFLPNALNFAAEKTRLCAEVGLIAHCPIDNKLVKKPRESLAQFGLRIASFNENTMRECDITIANLTPFRGPSADIGTGYEIGFSKALGKPVFGYSNTRLGFAERTRTYIAQCDDAAPDLAIEDFGLPDNLMIPGGLTLPMVLPAGPEGISLAFDDLQVFRTCLAQVVKWMALEYPG